MNTAYRAYLQDALDHYDRNDDKKAIRRFLGFLDDYQPAGDAKREPGVYAYGDAQGQYVPVTVDEDGLREHGVDPTRIPDAPRLLDAWACELGNRLNDEDAYGEWPKDVALTAALALCGLKRPDVSER